MPIYEYRCQDCGAVQEVLIAGSSPQKISCKRCGSLRLEKIISPAAVMVRADSRQSGHTCCGREERCDSPPCSSGGPCRHDRS